MPLTRNSIDRTGRRLSIHLKSTIGRGATAVRNANRSLTTPIALSVHQCHLVPGLVVDFEARSLVAQ